MGKPPPLSTLYAAALALLKQETTTSNADWKKLQPLDAPAAAVFDGLMEAFSRLPGFDPEGVVGPEGKQLWVALAQAPEAAPLGWVKSWHARFGQRGMGPDPRVFLSAWVDRYVRAPAMLKRWGSENALEGGVWLLEKVGLAPSPEEAQGWSDALSMGLADIAGGAARKALADRLLELLEQGASVPADPERAPDRWMRPEDQDPLDTTLRSVRCPSGRMRPLRDLRHLNGCPRGGHVQDSKVALPELPHQRRDELAFSWVLDSRVALPERRVRLWACVKQKPEVIQALIGRHQRLQRLRANAPAASGSAEEIREVLEARDPEGRTLLGFLNMCSELNTLDRAGAARWLLEGGFARWPDDLMDGEGRGLYHQHLRAVGSGDTDDPFNNPRPWSWGDFLTEGLRCPEAWLGPAEHLSEWADLLLDHQLPNRLRLNLIRPSHAFEEGQRILALLEAHPAVKGGGQDQVLKKVQQGLLVSFFFASLTRSKPTEEWVESQGDVKCAREALMEASKKLVASLEENALMLDITPSEWRQWGLLGLSAHLEGKAKNNTIDVGTMEALRSLDASMRRHIQHKAMQQVIDLPGSTARRPRM